jgi:aminomethyltransferase
MVPFAGFEMPIQYAGITSEHKAVRTTMGMFDLSHMGEFIVRGGDYLSVIDGLMTNEITNLEIGQARYTPMCFEHGGIVDDLLVYRYDNHVMLVVNASNIDKDLAWVRSHVSSDVCVDNVSDDTALIAVQGPDASAFVQTFTDRDLSSIGYYHFVEGMVATVPATMSRTGYTGEDGFELYVDADRAEEVWRALLAAGAPKGLCPVGLGARDTLRLEAGLALYGNDIDDSTSPLEGGLGWTVKLDGRDFVGAAALRKQKADGVTRRSVAFEMSGRGIPRQHCAVMSGERSVGEVTSGTFSPTFGKGLGLASVPMTMATVGTDLDIDIRGTTHSGCVVKRPMYRRT